MKAKHRIFNLIILDESGSMECIKEPTIKGFNELVQSIKTARKQFPEQEHTITFITFNSSGIKTPIVNQPVDEIDSISEELYHPNSMTPLYDAMGLGIGMIKKFTAKGQNYNVLVTVLTDGLENASREYTSQQIKNSIEELKLKNWTFTYIGTDHDVTGFAKNISINNVMVFDKSLGGVHVLFKREVDARAAYYENISKGGKAGIDYFGDGKDKDDNTSDESTKEKGDANKDKHRKSLEKPGRNKKNPESA